MAVSAYQKEQRKKIAYIAESGYRSYSKAPKWLAIKQQLKNKDQLICRFCETRRCIHLHLINPVPLDLISEEDVMPLCFKHRRRVNLYAKAYGMTVKYATYHVMGKTFKTENFIKDRWEEFKVRATFV